MILFLLQMKRPQQLSSRARLLNRPAAENPALTQQVVLSLHGQPLTPGKGQRRMLLSPRARYSCPTRSSYITPCPPLGHPDPYQAAAVSPGPLEQA